MNGFWYNVFAAPEPGWYRNLRSGNVDPRELRRWSYLDFTLQLLRERYGLFPDQHLVIDCPVHQLYPLTGERPEDFRRSFQLTAEGTIKFRCRRSIGCRRRHCSAKNNRSIDLYDLVALLEKKGREHARQVVSDFHEKLHGRKLGYFPKEHESGVPDSLTAGIMRHAVPKVELEKLFSIPIKGRGAGARFLRLALKIITGSPLVPYDGFNSLVGGSVLLSSSFDWTMKLAEFGIASRLFLWAHWRQAEAGSRLRLTDQDVADALGVDRRTIQNHKQLLVDLGYLKVEPADEKMSLWSAQYDSEKDTIL
ncbi:MAG: hypothetical protein WBG50_15275 [Desulfomonilaceae bacterium]